MDQDFTDLGVEVRRIACYASASTTTSSEILVGLGGFEPPTSPLSGVRSNQLSYRPKSCDLLLSFRLRPRIIRRELQFTKEYVNKRH